MKRKTDYVWYVVPSHLAQFVVQTLMAEHEQRQIKRAQRKAKKSK
jgi:hypothetical protein